MMITLPPCFFTVCGTLQGFDPLLLSVFMSVNPHTAIRSVLPVWLCVKHRLTCVTLLLWCCSGLVVTAVGSQFQGPNVLHYVSCALCVCVVVNVGVYVSVNLSFMQSLPQFITAEAERLFWDTVHQTSFRAELLFPSAKVTHLGILTKCHLVTKLSVRWDASGNVKWSIIS